MSERFIPVWFNAAEIPRQQRMRAFTETFATMVGPFDITFPQVPRAPLRMVHCALPGAGITTCFEVPALFRYDGMADVQDVLLVRPVGGAIRLRQGGRAVKVGERDATLLSLGRPFELDATGPAIRLDFLRLAAPAIARAATLAPSVLKAMSATDNRLALLTYYAGALLQGIIPLETERHARLAGNHLRDLAGTLFGLDEPGGSALEPGARMAAIKEQIGREYSQRDFCIETVATLQRVTPRYIQKLFAMEGTTFTRYVLEQRLKMAHAILRKGDKVAINAVAFDCGFGDLSYFNRTFRRHYGMTPSQVAQQAN